jgi:hypothetical protein
MTQAADQQVVEQTLAWVRHFIVGHNICPFAKRELENHSIRVEVVRSKKVDVALEELVAELEWLNEHPEAETTLLVFPTLFFSTTLLSLNFLGDGLRDALDPKDR